MSGNICDVAGLNAILHPSTTHPYTLSITATPLTLCFLSHSKRRQIRLPQKFLPHVDDPIVDSSSRLGSLPIPSFSAFLITPWSSAPGGEFGVFATRKPEGKHFPRISRFFIFLDGSFKPLVYGTLTRD